MYYERSIGIMSDNFSLKVCSAGKDHFDMSLKMCFSNSPGSKAKYYSVNEKFGMILYWSKPEEEQNSQPLPYEMDLNASGDFVWNWLKNTKYPKQPDHDGDNSKGFFITNGDGWGHVNGSFYSIVAVQPEYMMHGK